MNKTARLGIAQKWYNSATALLELGDFQSCISRCYYALYQGMWAALGNPPHKPRWEHAGIAKHFVRGYWYDTNLDSKGMGLFEELSFPLRKIYKLRLAADYWLDPITKEDAIWTLEQAEKILALIASYLKQ